MLDRGETEDLSQLFMLLDDNADGKLSREELIKGFELYHLGDSDDVD